MMATPVVFPHQSLGDPSLGLLTWKTPIVFKRGCFLLQAGTITGSIASAPKAAVMMFLERTMVLSMKNMERTPSLFLHTSIDNGFAPIEEPISSSFRPSSSSVLSSFNFAWCVYWELNWVAVILIVTLGYVALPHNLLVIAWSHLPRSDPSSSFYYTQSYISSYYVPYSLLWQTMFSLSCECDFYEQQLRHLTAD